MEFDFKDNSEEVKRALEEQAKKALTECGLFAQREAALNFLKTPWVFKDSKGEWHKTSGMQPSHFLKKAIEENKSTYNQIIRDNLKG